MARLTPTGVNAPQIEYWNGPAGVRWAGLADRQDLMMGDLGLKAMDACEIHPGHVVLDVGCGSGSTTIEIAGRVGSSGRVVGIDLSFPMLEIARARVEGKGIDHLSFENRDAATYPFEAETFDRVYSRFGVMFFVDPIAAFENIRSGMKAGGRLTFVCWQELSANAWMEIPNAIALNHVPPPPPADPRRPGPVAFAEPDWIREILSAAGFADIGIIDNQEKIPMGEDPQAAADKLVQFGPTSRLLGDAPDEIRTKVQNEVAEAIAPLQTESGIMMDSATWIVTAVAP